ARPAPRRRGDDRGDHPRPRPRRAAPPTGRDARRADRPRHRPSGDRGHVGRRRRPPTWAGAGKRLLVTLCLVAAGAPFGPVVAGASAAAPAPQDTSLCPPYNPPNGLALGGGTPQSAKLGAPFESNLQVALVNTNGCPITTQIAGIAVTFAA